MHSYTHIHAHAYEHVHTKLHTKENEVYDGSSHLGKLCSPSIR